MRYTITCLLIGVILMSGCSVGQTEKPVTEAKEQSKVEPEVNEAKESTESVVSSPVNIKPNPTATDTVANQRLIVSVGDSLTEGIGDSTDNGGYLPYLEGELEGEPRIQAIQMMNYGIKGNRSDQLLQRLTNKKIRQDITEADSIVVTIGGNDIMKVFKQHFTDLDMNQFTMAKREYEANLRQILDKIRRYNPSAPIYLVGIYNPFSKAMADLYELELIVSDWNKSGEQIISEYEAAYFIEIEDIFKNAEEDVLYTEDYFHPNDRGYELIATRIYQNMDISVFKNGPIEASIRGDESRE